MKTPNTKSIISAAAVLIFALASSLSGFSRSVKTPARHQRFVTENQKIHQDLLRIYMHRTHISSLRTKIRYDRTEGNKNDVRDERKELKKCRADLRKTKQDLRTDKRDLQKAYRSAIVIRKKLIRQDKRRIADSRNIEKKTPAGDNDKLVSAYKQDLAVDKYSLQEIRTQRVSNLLAVNKDIRRLKGEFFVFNYAEGGIANISNWMRK